MTIAELLQQMFNANEEQVNAFAEAMKTNKIYTASEENMDIRYGKLKTQHGSVTEQLNKANETIEELKKSNKGNEDLQAKVTEYETQIATLKEQLVQTQIESEVNVELLSAGVKPEDIDYVMFKLKAKGNLELGEDGKVKGMDDKIAALKTQLPAQFASGEGQKKILENKLPEERDKGDGITREALLKKSYAERMKLYSENPEAYKTAMNNNN